MTSRTTTHPDAGPVTFRADSHGYDIRVRVTDTRHASVTVSTDASRGPAYGAVRDAILAAGPGTLTAGLPETPKVDGGHADAACAISIDAELPFGSSVDLCATSGRVVVNGPVQAAFARATSGDVEVDHARTADLAATTGHLTLRQTGTARLSTSSGRISVGNVDDLVATASSGGISVSDARGKAALRTSSGDITVYYSGLSEPSVRAPGGLVWLRRIAPSAQPAVPDIPSANVLEQHEAASGEGL
jgi:hypothetical protein